MKDIKCLAGVPNMNIIESQKMLFEPPCDLMLRKDANNFTPVIFLNKELPDVLSCISRELKLLHAENCLTRKITGCAGSADSGPLASWYRSIFVNIFRDCSRADLTGAELRSQQEGHDFCSFYIRGSVFVPKRISAYQYVLLTLPPLWQNNRRVFAREDAFPLKVPPVYANRCKHKLFLFRYFPDTGLWYALESPSRSRQRIVQ